MFTEKELDYLSRGLCALIRDAGRVKRFWEWITGGEAVTVQELQKKLVLLSELM